MKPGWTEPAIGGNNDGAKSGSFWQRWPSGRYHLLHYEVADAEDEANWQTFWHHLIDRGLDPQAVELVVSDGTKGLLAAMAAYLPQAKLQRCTVYKIRGFERYLSYQALPDTDPDTGQPLTESQARTQRQTEICRDAHHIFKAPTRTEAQLPWHSSQTSGRPLSHALSKTSSGA